MGRSTKGQKEILNEGISQIGYYIKLSVFNENCAANLTKKVGPINNSSSLTLQGIET